MSRDLIDHAHRLIRATETYEVVWPRAVALLTRQALEEALADLWRYPYPGMEDASWSTQLACLDEVLDDDTLVGEIRMAWVWLSRACHHHHYELDPTAAELDRWIRQTERLVTVVAGGTDESRRDLPG